MGSGERQYRIALGEAKAMQEHQLAMIPIMQEQSEIQLEIREKEFEQRIEQTKQMNLLSQQLQPAPILMPADVNQVEPGQKNYLIYAGIAILAFYLLRKK